MWNIKYKLTFNIPNFTNRWLGGNGTGYLEAGLPNITGSINGWESNTSTYSHSGAFKLNKTVSGGEKNGNGVYVHTDFNASWCSTIYGNSTTVQPATCKTYFIIKY